MSTHFYCYCFLRLRDRATDLLVSMKPRQRILPPEKSEKVREKRTVRLIDPEPRPQNKTDTDLKNLEKMLEEKEEKIKRYEANTEESMEKISSLQKNATEEAEKMKKMVADLEAAKKEIQAVTEEKTELEVKLKNCQKAEEDKKQLREEVENQKTTITKLEEKNEATLKQLKFQGKI